MGCSSGLPPWEAPAMITEQHKLCLFFLFLSGGTGPHAAPQEFVTQLGIKLIQTALQLAKQGVLAQDSSQQRLNTNLNVVVEAARFCSACIHSECSKGEPSPSHSLDRMLPFFPVAYCSMHGGSQHHRYTHTHPA